MVESPDKYPFEKVEMIFTASNFSTAEGVEDSILYYQKRNWRDYPTEAETLCRRLLAAGKIDDTRRTRRQIPRVHIGKWWYDRPDRIDWEDVVTAIDQGADPPPQK